LNDYSIPPDRVGRPLTLTASPRRVRILDGADVVADHARTYDRGQPVLDPAHQEALLAEKRHALGSTPGGALLQAVPESETLLDAAFRRGESAARQTTQLLRLLDEYGAEALRAAVREALEHDTPRAASVSFLLNRRRRGAGASPRPVDLSRHPELAQVEVRLPDLEVYDELSDSDPDSD
jgi:hypothetical protein